MGKSYIPGSTFSWDNLLHCKQPLSLMSCKHWVYLTYGFATAMLMYIPVFWDMTPCRSVRINQAYRETHCFLLLHAEFYRTGNVFILTVTL
jgi:hypothetical protein